MPLLEQTVHDGVDHNSCVSNVAHTLLVNGVDILVRTARQAGRLAWAL